MKQFFLHFLIYIPIILSGCTSNSNDTSSYNNDLQELVTLKAEIETLANKSVCNDDTQCKYIALGSKPCGGPWSYLIYSTSIDVQKLESLVENYNEMEAVFTTTYKIVSDCKAETPPSGFTCENNTCSPVY